jgi:hypothetical protein
MRRLLSLVRVSLLCALVLLTVAAACSNGDRGEGADDESVDDERADDGSDDDFCGLLEASVGEDAIDLETDEGTEAFAELVEAAPDELAEPMGVIEDALSQVTDFDEDDPEAFSEAFDALFDPDVVAAFEEVEAYGVETCGLPEGFLDNGTDGGVDGTGGEAEDGDGDGSGGGDFVSTDEVQAHLEATYGDVPPFSEIVGWSSVNGVFSVSFDVAPSVDDATDVCQAISAYIYDIAGYDPSIEVGVYGPSDQSVVLREGSGSTCQAP